jgi:hypothetical protein
VVADVDADAADLRISFEPSDASALDGTRQAFGDLLGR